jgi:hypothetical protein
VRQIECFPSAKFSAGGKDSFKAVDAESFTPAGNSIEHVMCRSLRKSFKEAVSVWGNTRAGDLT